MYICFVFLIFLLRGAESTRTSVVQRRYSDYEEMNDKPRRCDEATSIEELLGCPSGSKYFAYNEREIRGNIEYLCTFSKQACKVTMVPIYCLLGEVRVDPGAGFVHGKLYYMCNLSENNMGVEIIGCATEEGMRVQFGQRFRYGNLVFLCQNKGGKIETVFSGCDYGTGLINIGETYSNRTTSIICQEKEVQPLPTKQETAYRNSSYADLPPARVLTGVNWPDQYGQMKQSIKSQDTRSMNKSAVREQMTRFCMISREVTKCTFRLNGRPYLLQLGYGQWIGRQMFFCDFNDQGAAELCAYI